MIIKNSASGAISATLLILFMAAGLAQSMENASLQALPKEEAYKILNDLNEKNALFPESLMGMSGKYTGLNAENCFGIEPEKGWKLAAECTGKNNYGIEFKYAGDPSSTRQIGFIYSSAPFLIADKTMPAGAYAVLANVETLQLSGNTGTFHSVQNRQVADMLTEQIPLPSKLDLSLFEAKSPNGPQFTFVQEGRGVFFVLGENKIPIRKK